MSDAAVMRPRADGHNNGPNQRGGYELPTYPFAIPPELAGGDCRRYQLVIVGAGLAGLTFACEMRVRGIPAVVLDEDDTVGVYGASSRGICYAQKSLEVFARLGICERVCEKGVRWSVGRTLAGDDEIYSFDLAHATTHEASAQPPFINLQQFYVESFLVERIEKLNAAEGDDTRIDLRWKSRVVACTQDDACVTLTVETPAGRYAIEADWVVDCAGLYSVVRDSLGLPVNPAKGIDRWCISDVRFTHTPPAERLTWIEAPFNENRAVWQHLMADDVWRLDYQMDASADLDDVTRPDMVAERLARHFGPDVEYEILWVGPYSYRSQMLENFRHGRVLFAGDSAHVMSPFGARGGNSGIQDAENLAWKLALVLEGRVPPQCALALLDSYSHERVAAARQNILLTDRTNRFLTPHSPVEKQFRDAVIALAKKVAFARAFVNTGRLSIATRYVDSPLSSTPNAGGAFQNVALTLPDGSPGDLVALLLWARLMTIGIVFAPLSKPLAQALAALEARYPVRFVACPSSGHGVSGSAPLATIRDEAGRLARLCGYGTESSADATPHSFALIRPDLHLAATLPLSLAAIEGAIRKALALA